MPVERLLLIWRNRPNTLEIAKIDSKQAVG